MNTEHDSACDNTAPFCTRSLKLAAGLAALSVPALLSGCDSFSAVEPPACENSEDQESEPVIVSQTERARDLLGLFLSRDYDALIASGTDQVQAGLTVELLETIHSSIAAQVGAFRAEIDIQLQTTDQFDLVSITAAFERGTAGFRVVLDAEQRLAGFFIDSLEPADVYTPPAYVDPTCFEEQAVTLQSGAFELPGTLTLPHEAGSSAAIVLVHGSGPHDQDESVFGNKPFRDLAWGLGSKGIAVLRYEKRTHRYGADIDPAELTLEEETIDDALAAVRLLKEQPGVDPERIYVLGHSLGGFAAPFIAAADDDIAGIVLAAGNSRSILDLIDEQLEYLAEVDGSVSAAERAQLDALQAITASIRTGSIEDTPPLLGVPAAYWLRLHQLDTVAAAQQLTQSVLVLQGGRDYQVTEDCFEGWRAGLSEHDAADFKYYESLNHLFMAGSGPSTPQEYQQSGHVAEEVVTDIADWINSQ